MRLFGIALFASVAVCGASTAWAQYGLYGSPDVLPAQQQNAPANYGVPAQPAPAAYAAPAQPQYGTPAQAAAQTTYQAYRYPAQPPATAMYQPHQPGAQYQYPSPANRPAAWTAPAEQPALMQPIPAPAAGLSPVNPPAPNYGAPPQGSGMMNQMLAEQGNGCAPGCNDLGNCGQGALCGQENCCPWYASLSAIVVSRSDGRRLWTSHDSGDETIQLTNTQFDLAWKWGGEVRFGRRFCYECVPYAVEVSYWTGEAFNGHRNTTNPGGYVSTPLELNSLSFGGTAAQNWFDGAREHRLTRHDEFHNIEVNLVREQLAWCSDSGWDIGWSLGVRYFRFQDFLEFGSRAYLGVDWGDLPNTAYLSDRVTNNLIGPQFGFDAAYRMSESVRLFISPKVGIFDNYLDSTFIATTGNGIVGHGPYGDFPVHSTRNGLAFLTQIDVGADCRFSRNWSARAGYRVVAVTGVGLADDQFPQYINDIPEIANVAHTSSLVLHGAFAGLTYNF